MLCAAFDAGTSLASASKGAEREAFVTLFLSQVLPTIYRFGTGVITDSYASATGSRRSGQIDVVIEMPFAPSFPALVGSDVRLYPAEAVGVAIEVKSDVSAQWKDVLHSAGQLGALRQTLNGNARNDA